MLDLTGIMFSSIMMLLVVLRALQLGRTEPWFQSIKKRTEEKAKAKQPVWRRRG